MIALGSCPACSGGAWIDLPLPVDVPEVPAASLAVGSPVLLADSAFALCRRCALLFARRRQASEEAAAYYAAFPELEGRVYAGRYPPPPEFLAAQEAFAEYLVGVLDGADLLRPGLSVLNLRCESGAHLFRLRQRFGLEALYGLDHFESNRRYGREVLGLRSLALLDPVAIEPPFGPPRYDLILANHLVTHALEPMPLLLRLRELLAPGGALVLYNEIDHLPVLRRRKRHRRGFNNFHKQLLTRVSLENLCALAGLDARLLSCEAKGRRWAASGHSMVVLAREAEPVPPEALVDVAAEVDAVRAAADAGRRALASGRWLDAAQSLVGAVGFGGRRR